MYVYSVRTLLEQEMLLAHFRVISKYMNLFQIAFADTIIINNNY